MGEQNFRSKIIVIHTIQTTTLHKMKSTHNLISAFWFDTKTLFLTVGVSLETSEKTTMLCKCGLFVLFHRDIFVTMRVYVWRSNFAAYHSVTAVIAGYRRISAVLRDKCGFFLRLSLSVDYYTQSKKCHLSPERANFILNNSVSISALKEENID